MCRNTLALRGALTTLPGQTVAGRRIAMADDFAYLDPVDGSTSKGQGLRVVFEDGARFVLRLSGTGTEGATLRLYLETPCEDPDQFDADPQAMLAPVAQAAETLAGIARVTGRLAPDVVT